MTKVFKWLGGTVAAVVGGVALLAASGGLNATDVAAQSPPTPPARFVGTVMVDGDPAADGTLIEARVGGATCGTDQVDSGRYAVDVSAQAPAAPSCGTEGAVVTFYIGGLLAEQSGTWINYDINVVNLTYTTPTPTPTATTSTTTPVTTTPSATSTGTVTSTATTAPGGNTATPRPGGNTATPRPGGNTATPRPGGTGSTPRPPSTGTGASAGDESAAWLFALLGAGALAFGVGGAAVARRSR